MELVWSDEQRELRETARAFLTEHADSEALRRAAGSEAGFDPALWKRMGDELGWTGVAIPEKYGGLGLGPVELVALCEVMGEALVCAPFFSSVVLAGGALLAAGSEAQKRAHLPGIAAGATRGALAWSEPGGTVDAATIATLATPDGGDFVLAGRKRYVVDGHSADLLLVAARLPGTRGEDGVALFAVPGESNGLARRALPTLDPTRRLAEIDLDDVRVPADARIGAGETEFAALARALDLAAVALAAEQLGGAERCLELAVAHAKSREQFGRPIGSFQAIAHKCADMLLRLETARSAVHYAACVAAEDPDALGRAASLARAYTSEAYFACAAECLQIHGGVGFTWEYDVHLHLKRARASALLLGDPDWHRERVLRELGL